MNSITNTERKKMKTREKKGKSSLSPPRKFIQVFRYKIWAPPDQDGAVGR